MNHTSQFEIMRPYRGKEIPEAIDRVVNSGKFKSILKYLYPKKDTTDIINDLKTVSSTQEFQQTLSKHAFRQAIEISSDSFTYSGIEQLDTKTPYLFISNHRDIVLDSASLQVALLECGHNTSQITFGSNLMSDQFIVDIGKLNNMFTYYREGSKLEKYQNAKLHSAYIRDAITNLKESVWIAQRSGRTKDGNDQTQLSLIKMLMISENESFKAIKDLNIVPVSISYEIEPCDIQKSREIYINRSRPYIKEPGEDLSSIVSGIVEDKGKMHLSFGKPVNSEIDKIDRICKDSKELAQEVCSFIDSEIYRNYTLWRGNYIAFDIKESSCRYLNSRYSAADRDRFISYIDSKLSNEREGVEDIREILINIYANPVVNSIESDLL